MSHRLKALATAVVMLVHLQVFSAASHEQLVKNSELAIGDWKKVLSVLKSSGMDENDPAYKRVENALHRNQGRLKALGKAQSPQARQIAQAAGAGLLSKLGGMFGGSSSESQKTASVKETAKKAEPTKKRPAASSKAAPAKKQAKTVKAEPSTDKKKAIKKS